MLTNPIQFIESYFNSDENFFITLINHNSNKVVNYFHNISSFKTHFEKIEFRNQTDSIYFTCNSFKQLSDCIKNTSNNPIKVKENVSHIKALIFDFDEPTSSVTNLSSLIKQIGQIPTYIAQTSKNKFQVCYKLKEEDIDFNEYELVNKTLATYFKSDINVCSVEKLFRLPFFVNKKNDFPVELKRYDFNNIYNFDLFKNFVLSNNETKLNFTTFSSNQTDTTLSPAKLRENPSMTNVPFATDNNIMIDDKQRKAYNFFLYKMNNDASRADLMYSRSRSKQTNDFDLIFNEILALREFFNKPLKRELNKYYQDRKNCFQNV